MNSSTQSGPGALWTGRVLSTLALAPMVFSAAMKLSGSPQVMQGMTHLGFSPSLVKILFVLETLSVVLYVIPRTAVVGAILLTGYMGGAICTHLRVGENVLIQTLIPIIAWLGLYLREPRLRGILPLR